MAKMAVIINKCGIQGLSFICRTDDDRKIGLELYAVLEEELRHIDDLIKNHFGQDNNELDIENGR